MPIAPADFGRLTLLIQRLQDADVLCEAEGDTLLTGIKAARETWEQGEYTAAQKQLEMVVQETNALLGRGALKQTAGNLLLQAAEQLMIDLSTVRKEGN